MLAAAHLWQPFNEFVFMRRALFGGLVLACSTAPLGVFLILRRMSLIGDAVAHGILPGAALGFWFAGLSLPALTIGGLGPLAHGVFLTLVVLNLVIGFQAIGALMVVGLMMLPAAASRFWSRRLPVLISIAALLGSLSVWLGLLLSFYYSLPSGPAIVLVAGGLYLLSVVFGPVHGLLRRPPLLTSQ
ncbi:metal ABC transporter permease [Pseudomonas sp. PD9R]|uniref:metal ABC transporter permease n=1 Tax=Pseudomonas sp. PD9R TaxID=2853534 RepID=UPI001C43F687|nr:metal ABC transporter permease [Pseudomonas sp. PD9R]MBV6825380.1 metal ABC transporter permease [Pseudomonas sp. PD9R]